MKRGVNEGGRYLGFVGRKAADEDVARAMEEAVKGGMGVGGEVVEVVGGVMRDRCGVEGEVMRAAMEVDETEWKEFKKCVPAGEETEAALIRILEDMKGMTVAERVALLPGIQALQLGVIKAVGEIKAKRAMKAATTTVSAFRLDVSRYPADGEGQRGVVVGGKVRARSDLEGPGV
jgi:hypothetical protein